MGTDKASNTAKKESFYKSFFKDNQEIMLLINLETSEIEDCNLSACYFYGYSCDEMLKLKVTNFNMLTTEQVTKEMNLAKAEKRDRFYYKHRLANGEVRDAEVHSTPVNIEGKDLLLFLISDVTGNKNFNDALWAEKMLFEKTVAERTYKQEEANTIIDKKITEMKRAEEVLNVSETHYRRLFETAKDGILILDAETGKIMDVNPFLIELLGYSKKQLIEKAIWEIGIFKDVVANKDNFLELQQKEYIRYEDLPLQTADGRRIAVEFVSNVYLVDHQKVIQCNIRDITERKRTEEALIISENRYRRLFETAKDGILILDAETGKIMDVNPFLIELLGYSEEQLIEKAIWEIGVFKDVVANMEKFLELQQKEYIRYENLPLQTADGRRIAVEFVSNVYLVDHQKVIQCNIRDITERKRLESALAKEKKLLETTLISVGDGVISCDSNGYVVFMNRVAESLTGWTQDSASGKMIEEVFDIVNELTREKSKNIFKVLIESGKVIEPAKHTMLISKNAIERAIEFTAAPIVGENGEIFGVVLVFRDFSEKRLKQEEIEFLSYHDQLTGLYNRRFYELELKRLDKERNLPLTIAMGDVNGLKLINDSFGHAMGDELLMKVGEVIKKGCRAEDIIARLGGDEFVIILPKTDAVEAEQIIKRIMYQSLKEKVGSIDISISFGYDTKNDKEENIQEIFKNTEDHMYRHKLYESSSMRSKTIDLIMSSLFEKNHREMLHSERVSEICGVIANEMGMDSDNVSDLKTAGLMHDIGKIGIDETILNKTQKLNDAEWNEIKRHPEIGYRILSSVNEFSEIADCVLEHHERWDGQGYPKGLKGEEITSNARIIAFADAYDAMTSDRTYGKALSEVEAINEVRRCSGTQFDPSIVNVFVTKILRKREIKH